MSLTTTTKISLDLYNNNVVIINAKQFDAESRYVNITCTDYGRVLTLNSNSLSAFVRYKKSDGNTVFNNTTILEDGTIQVELTQQMLAVEGRQTVDILILSTGGLTVDNIVDANDFTTIGAAIMSTMTFYINVVPTAADHDDIISTSEFDALTMAIAKVAAMETHLEDLDSELSQNEEIRQTNEGTRIEDEAVRQINEASRQQNEEERQTNEEARIAAELERQNSIEACNIATDACNAATSDAIEAAEKCNSIIDQTGVVLKTGDIMTGDLGVPNLNAEESISIGGKAKFYYDTDLNALVLTFL